MGFRRAAVGRCALTWSLALGSACASAQGLARDSRPAWEKYIAACPIPEGKLGYPIVARATGVDSLTLSGIARAVGRRWPRIPRADEDTTRKPEDVHAAPLYRLATPHAALHRRNWIPRIGDTATLDLLYRRDERPRVISSGGDTPFHRRVARAVSAALARSQQNDDATEALPDALPDGAPDSTLVRLYFGVEPSAGDGVARFAVMETEVSPKKGNKPPWYPEAARSEGRQGQVRVAFILTDSGKVDMRTARVLSFDHRDMAASVADFLAAASFNPHVIDCVTVTEVLMQPFNFTLTRAPAGVTYRP